MSRELRNAQILIGTDDLSEADGMMELPDGRVVGAIDLTPHVVSATIKGSRLMESEERCEAISPESETRCDLLAGHNDSHEAQTGPSSLVSWANTESR